jgi:hypothetical protein
MVLFNIDTNISVVNFKLATVHKSTVNIRKKDSDGF